MARQFVVCALVFIAVVGLATAQTSPASAPVSAPKAAVEAPTKAVTATATATANATAPSASASSPKGAQVPSASSPGIEEEDPLLLSPPAITDVEAPLMSEAPASLDESAEPLDDESLTGGAAAMKISGAVAVAAVAGFFAL